MEKLRITAYILIVISIIMILAGTIMFFIEAKIKEECLNLEFQDLYNKTECATFVRDF